MLAISACAILVLIVNFLSSVGLALFCLHLLRIVSHELVRSMALRFDFSLPCGVGAHAPVCHGDFEAWRGFVWFLRYFCVLYYCRVKRDVFTMCSQHLQSLRELVQASQRQTSTPQLSDLFNGVSIELSNMWAAGHQRVKL